MQKSPWKHMAAYDYPLYASFVLTDEGRSFDRWEWDVTIGRGNDPGPLYTEEERRKAIYLRSFKIDALGWKDGKATIFEVKPDARLSAFGQVKGYCHHFTRQYGAECELAIITDTMTVQMFDILMAHDIKIHLVQPATTQQVILACQITNAANCHLVPEIVEGYSADTAHLYPWLRR